jgi:Putative MetA-pathway of phenol degradation
MRFYYLTATSTLLPLLASAQITAADTAALKRSYTLFQPVPKELLRDFSPDRPGISQSAHTVDAGHFQLETDLFRLRREDEQMESRRNLHLADLTLKVGLTRTLDFHVNVQPMLRERVVPEATAQPAEPPRTDRHFGDVTLRLKQNLFGNDGGAPHVLALSGYVRLPTGGPVGAGRTEFGVALPYEFDFSESFDMEAQIEAESRWDRTSAQREIHLNQSLLADYRFGRAHKLEIFAEGAGFWNIGQHTYQATLNIGPAFYAAPAVRLDAGVHIPLTRNPLTREVFAGISWRI